MTDRAPPTILVVDDHEATRYGTCRNLRAGGYQTIEAANGADALRLAPTASAMVLDVHLPDIDGFEVCKQVRATEGLEKLPIVHVSSVYVTGFSEARARRVGADEYLVSPVDPQKLLAVLNKLLA